MPISPLRKTSLCMFRRNCQDWTFSLSDGYENVWSMRTDFAQGSPSQGSTHFPSPGRLPSTLHPHVSPSRLGRSSTGPAHSLGFRSPQNPSTKSPRVPPDRETEYHHTAAQPGSLPHVQASPSIREQIDEMPIDMAFCRQWWETSMRNFNLLDHLPRHKLEAHLIPYGIRSHRERRGAAGWPMRTTSGQ